MTRIVYARAVGLWLTLVFATFTVASCGGGGSSSAPSDSALTSGTPASAATLSWAAPSENTDGSALTNLAGYRVYYGTVATDLTEVVEIPTVGMTEYVIADLTAGAYYFSIRAYTSAGIESALSNVVSTTIA